MIRDFLGWPDSVKGHALHRKYMKGTRLWLVSRVEAVEATPEFQKRWRRLTDARLDRMERAHGAGDHRLCLPENCQDRARIAEE